MGEKTRGSAEGSEDRAADETTDSLAFAGWGRAQRIDDLDSVRIDLSRVGGRHQKILGQWHSTAICGNDISSSVLYVSALCAAQAGALAPAVLLIVSAVLYLYRRIYAEVCSALPLNGGTYTLLLNTTNKKFAAAAACLTLLSYIATAVISANDAMEYAHGLFGGINVIWATIVVLGVFALLNIVGLRESSTVALVIFVLHLATLTVLVASAGILVLQDPTQFRINWSIPSIGGAGHALFYGFAAAMLGISGFESSANFIEQQKDGVFPKTLRNMWVVVTIFNPLVSLLALGLLPLERIQAAPPDLLAQMGSRSLGAALGSWVSIDAVLVLSGAVLTSYVGVTGLVRRMALDQCLPQLLLRQNRWRKTNHWIIAGFFFLCTSILLVTEGSLAALAGVYTLAFLSVMALYAVGNMLLKVKRSRLPRDVRAGWPTVILALAAVSVGITGNVLLSPANVEVFAVYYGLSLLLVGVVLLRIEILKLMLYVSRAVLEEVTAASNWVNAFVLSNIERIGKRAVVYFTHGDDIAHLNRAALYVLANEQTRLMKVVFVYEKASEIPRQLKSRLAMIDKMYPRLKIDFLMVKGTFGPELVERLSRRLRVPKNMMFIGTPGDQFPHEIGDLGGVRVIL